MKIILHAAAPAKPLVGAPCNGCGVCCSIAPCPLSRLLLGHRTGKCPVLTWQGGYENERYVCGLVVAPAGFVRWLPRRFVLRWISAGSGCDCDAEVELSAA
jgi:hypothetical protein